jgi:hypothetical protein
VVDHHRFLVVRRHLLVQREQIGGVELVERGRPGRIEHGHEPGRGVAALGAGHDAARLVRVVTARVRHDLVVDDLLDAQHDARAY